MKPAWMSQLSADGDVEALQTDVMRFIAILGLCLAVIFSLLQGAASEQARAREQMQTPSETAVQVTGEAQDSAPQRVREGVADRVLEPVPESVSETVSESVSESLSEKTSEEASDEFAGGSLKYVPPKQADTPAKRERRQEAADISQAPVPEVSAPPPAPEPSASPGAAEGFTLEFASAQALGSLLESGRVRLYARVSDEFWLLDARGHTSAVQPPDSYYAMQADTVPAHLRGVFSNGATAAVVRWGVSLPEDAVAQIDRLTREQSGGALLISANGAVTLAR